MDSRAFEETFVVTLEECTGVWQPLQPVNNNSMNLQMTNGGTHLSGARTKGLGQTRNLLLQ